MKFDDICSNVLREEISREDRIKALKHLTAFKDFRVIDTSTSRGLSDIHSDTFMEGKNLQSVTDTVLKKILSGMREDFGDEDSYEEYVNDWVEAKYCDTDEMSAIITGEETCFFIFGPTSRFFGIPSRELANFIEEIDSSFDW